MRLTTPDSASPRPKPLAPFQCRSKPSMPPTNLNIRTNPISAARRAFRPRAQRPARVPNEDNRPNYTANLPSPLCRRSHASPRATRHRHLARAKSDKQVEPFQTIGAGPRRADPLNPHGAARLCSPFPPHAHGAVLPIVCGHERNKISSQVSIPGTGGTHSRNPLQVVPGDTAQALRQALPCPRHFIGCCSLGLAARGGGSAGRAARAGGSAEVPAGHSVMGPIDTHRVAGLPARSARHGSARQRGCGTAWPGTAWAQRGRGCANAAHAPAGRGGAGGIVSNISFRKP